jgi:hypothetical protein
MKTFNKVLITIFVLSSVFCMAANVTSNVPSAVNASFCPTSLPQISLSFQVFYDELSPHGTWISYNTYGYVWIPDAGPDFYPYSTGGQWVYTDAGWTWYSTYSWGWAPFHYGRWFYDNYYGWMWVPDTQWAPAWVMWRSGGDYYGWTPLEPGISINIVFGGGYQPPHHHWVFVRNSDINRNNVSNYTVNNSSNKTIINNTTIIQNTRSDNQTKMYVTGPDKHEVHRFTGKAVKQLAIQQQSRPGQDMNGSELSIYKPEIRRDEESGKKSAPSKVEALNDVRPIQERYHTGPQRNSNPDKQSGADTQRNSDKQRKSDKQSRTDKQSDSNREPAQNKAVPKQTERKQAKGKKDGSD